MASQIVGVVAVLLLALAVGMRGAELGTWLQESTVAQFLIVTGIALANLLIIGWFISKAQVTLGKIGVVKPELRDVGYALAGFGIYFVIYIFSISIISHYVPGLDVEQEQELGFSTTQAGLNLWLAFASLVILPPLIEEFVMRGFLFSGLRVNLSFVWATVITSLLFAAAHLPNGKDGLLWVGAIDTFILSYILCYIREKTGSIMAGVGIHMLKNGLAFTVLFIFPDVIS